MKRFSAFSLAEILVTLMIIAVIAAMTIPALRKDATNRTIATNLKKVYAELNQATSLAMTQAEANKLIRTGIFDSQQQFDDEFMKKHFNVLKECPQGSAEACFGNNNLVNSKSYLLSNGIALSFSGCLGMESDYWCNVMVDVTGPKSPNKGGVDQFMFAMNANDGRVYLGSGSGGRSGSDFDDSCDSNDDYAAAWACGAKIQQDGWTIKY